MSSSEEQIFLLEMRVDRVKLDRRNIEEVGARPLLVNVKFSDLPDVKISRDDSSSAESSTPGNDGVTEFRSGRSFLFAKQPRDVSRTIKSTPLKIGIFREGDTFPIALGQVSPSGCLCDQIAMAANDAKNFPKPYVHKGTFQLLDPGENEAGSIDFEFRLSCLGKFVTTKYLMDYEDFLMKNGGDKNIYRARKVEQKGKDSEEGNGGGEDGQEIVTIE